MASPKPQPPVEKSPVSYLGNVVVSRSDGLTLPQAGDAPHPSEHWPRYVGLATITLGLAGVFFLPPPGALALLAPRVVRAADAFPDWYRPAMLAMLFAAIALHALAAATGTAIMLRSPASRWLVGILGAMALAVTGATLVLVETALAGASDLPRQAAVAIRDGRTSLYIACIVEAVWPIALCGWFCRRSVRTAVRDWAAFARIRRVHGSDGRI